MPMATVTVRQLKNKDTGIDITVPTYEENPGLLTKTIEFQITVVTTLAVFKSPKHKETDVVQFVVGKKFSDFEDLYVLLNEKFSGIAFPALPKKVLISTDEVNKERRGALDNLMKFFSKTPRISNYPVLLEFLGASPKVLRAETLIIKEKSDDSIDSGVSPSKDFVDDMKSPSDESDIFGENEDEPSDPFSDMKTEPFLERKNTETALFGDSPEHKSYEVKMFEEQDYSGGLSKDDELLFGKGAEKKPNVSPIVKSGFDTDGLLNVEDDFDQLLKITKKSKRAPKLGQSAHGTDERPKSSISLSSPDKSFNVPSSADAFMKYIEENTSRDEVDLFS